MDGQIRIAASECNYKEIDRQLKEQFIHILNDNDMMVEIIKELTKLKKIKMFQAIEYYYGKVSRGPKSMNNSCGQFKSKPGIWCHPIGKVEKYMQKPQQNQTSTCKYSGSSHPPQRCLVSGKKCRECGNVNHFRAVWRKARCRAVHKEEQEPDEYTVEDG